MNTDQTQQKIEELKQLRTQIRRWRIGTTVASFVIITSGLVFLKMSATDLIEPGPKHDAFVAELREDMTTEVVPYVKQRTVQAWNDLTPVLKAEVIKVHQRSPEIAEAVIFELETMREQLPIRAEAILDATIGEMVRERTDRLKAEFPELTEKEILDLAQALLEESHLRVMRLADAVVAPYLASMDHITSNLFTIRATEAIVVPQDAAALDLALALVDVVREEINTSAPNDPSWTLLSTVLAQAK